MEGNLFRYYAFACFVLVGTASLAVSLVISRYVSHIDPFAQVKLKMSEKNSFFKKKTFLDRQSTAPFLVWYRASLVRSYAGLLTCK